MEGLGKFDLRLLLNASTLEQDGQGVDVVRAEYDIHPGGALGDALLVLLRQTPTDCDLHLRIGRLGRRQMTKVAVKLVVGVLPDCARVEHDEVGLALSDCPIARLFEQARDPFRIMDVHLAAIGDYAIGGHRQSLTLQRRPPATALRTRLTRLRSVGLNERMPAGISRKQLLLSSAFLLVCFTLLALNLDSSIVKSIDASAGTWFRSTADSSPLVRYYALACDVIGNIPMAAVVASAAIAGFWLAGQRRVAGLLATTAIGGFLLNNLTKDALERPRPTGFLPLEVEHSWSFPSGHAMSGIYVFAALGLAITMSSRTLGARASGIALVVFGFTIGLTRLTLGVHWFSDVLGAWLLAGAWVCAVASLYAPIRIPDPMPSPTRG